MGQEQILTLCKKVKKKMRAREIAKRLNVNVSTVNKALKQLKKFKEIKIDFEKDEHNRYVMIYFL